MPGIVGVVGNLKPHRFSLAIEKIKYFPNYVIKHYKISPTLNLAHVSRSSKRKYDSWHHNKELGLAVLVHGAVFKEDPRPHRLSAADVLHDFLEKEWGAWLEYDGSFCIVIIDLRKNRLHLVNDRYGTLPLYYCESGGSFVFGPEAKAVLTAAGTSAEFSEHGLVNFLVAGFNLADFTLFKNIHFLQPGSLLTYVLDSKKLIEKRLWKIEYEPDSTLRKRSSAEEALFESILKAHKLFLSDRPDNYELFLSGGLDSRGILGTLDRLDALPTRTLSWGLRKDIPNSDAFTAEQIANIFNVPFIFQSYDTDGFPEIAEEWAYISELANDNFGWYGEGFSALKGFYNTNAEFSFIGDEAWGNQEYAFNEFDARKEAVLSPNLPSTLKCIMRSDRATRAESLYDESITKVMLPCESHDWTERKDFLYLHGRLARFIFSLGYYREISTEHRRPFLVRGVMDVIRRMPNNYRVHKNLYVSMLRHFLPKTMLVPNKAVRSLPSWTYDVRYKLSLRKYFLDLLSPANIMQGPLCELIDSASFVVLRDVFFSGTVVPPSQKFSYKARLKRTMFDQLIRCPGYKTAVRFRNRLSNQSGSSVQMDAITILRRVALCVLLQRQLGRLSGTTDT